MNALKQFVGAFLLSAVPFCLHAELVVLEHTGSARAFAPSEVKRITFEGGKMCVQTYEGETFEWHISGVQKCYFGELPEIPTAIIALQKGKISILGNTLQVTTGAKAWLKVVNAEGKLVLAKKVPAGSTSVSLEQIPAGVYVVTIGHESLKLMKQ